MQLMEYRSEPNSGPLSIPAPSDNEAGNPIWSPDPPFIDNRLQYTFGRPFEETSAPSIHLHIPFLGKDGSKLLQLRRITATVDPETGFHGFAFAYGDGSEVLYGRRHVVDIRFASRCCVEQPFPINGGKGEFITQARITTRKNTRLDKWIPQSIEVRPLPIGPPI